MSIDDQIKSLTKNEIIVLYWKCRGLNHEQISLRLTYSKDWVQLQVSNAYKKLGFEKSMHWTQRIEILKKEVGPRLVKIVEDRESEEEITEESIVEVVDTKADPEMMALVLYDEKMLTETNGLNAKENQKKKETQIIEIPSVLPRRSCLPRVLMGLLVIGLLIVVGYGAYVYGRNSAVQVTPEVQVITATFPPATETRVYTLTPIFTQTSLPTFTFTPAPSFTLLPTATPKGYIDQGENIELRDGVYAYISENFQGAGNPCWKPDGGFAVIIYIENTSDDYFDIRFDATAFHAVDNFGNEYQLLGSDIFYCNEKVGIIEGSLRGGDRTNLGAQFSGIIPLDAEYVDITIDFISGFGPITFRKYIY